MISKISIRVFCFLSGFLLTSFGASSSKPSSPTILSLKQAQEIALKQHPEIRSNDYLTKAAQEGIKQAESHYFPQVAGNGIRTFSGTNTRLAATGEISNPRILNRASYGVSAQQMITDFGRTGHLVAAAKAGTDAQLARSLSVRDRILFDVTRAYYNVLRSQKILQVAQKTVSTRKTLLEQVETLYTEQLKSELDVSITQQMVDEANLLLLKAENELDDAHAELSQALGYGKQALFTLKDISIVEPFKKTLKEIISLAINHNPEINSLKAQLSAAESQHQAEKAAHYPTINAVGYAGQSPVRNDIQLNSSYAAAAIDISIPIYTGGRLTANEKQAFYKVQSIKKELENKNNQVIRDVHLVWNNLQTTYKNIKITEELLKNSTKAELLMQTNYDMGNASIVDLAQTQLNQTRAEIANSNAIYEYLINLALLKFHVGIDL